MPGGYTSLLSASLGGFFFWSERDYPSLLQASVTQNLKSISDLVELEAKACKVPLRRARMLVPQNLLDLAYSFSLLIQDHCRISRLGLSGKPVHRSKGIGQVGKSIEVLPAPFPSRVVASSDSTMAPLRVTRAFFSTDTQRATVESVSPGRSRCCPGPYGRSRCS